MYICPHVHFRDEEEAHKETIANGLRVAELAGFTAVFDMPNPQRIVINESRVKDRLELAKRAKSPVWYGTYVGLTANPDQIKEAVKVYHKYPQVVGLKLFACQSTGALRVHEFEAQKIVWQTLAKENYKGIVVVHAEKEQYWNDCFDPENPITHAYAQPWQSEVVSALDQLYFAEDTGFEGKIHFAHVSVPLTAFIANKQYNLNITTGVTPHHLIYDQTAMNDKGLTLKMNPPLRPPEYNLDLLQMLENGLITWVETDHALHTLEEKLKHPYCSGIPGLDAYPRFINWLKSNNFSEDRIRDLTFNNIVKTFGLDLKPRECTPVLDLDEYEVKPYEGVL